MFILCRREISEFSAAAVKSEANGIFHVAASEVNWIGKLAPRVSLCFLTG